MGRRIGWRGGNGSGVGDDYLLLKPFLADLVVLPEAGVLADLGAAFDLCQ